MSFYVPACKNQRRDVIFIMRLKIYYEITFTFGTSVVHFCNYNCLTFAGADGKLDITTHITDPENPNDISFQEALLNLERSQNQGNLVLPNNATVDAAQFMRYILKPG